MDYSALVRSYTTLSYTYQLRSLLAAFFQTDEYNALNKYELAKTVSDVVFKNYSGEQILKYKLAKEFINKDYIAAFEVKAKTSRADFLVINGESKSFEVKSKIDNLKRLRKQTCDYGDVFEYNTVVIDKTHLESVLQIIPEYYGLWCYEGGKRKIFRKANYSQGLNPIEQINLFNKRELVSHFGSDNRDEILSTTSEKRVNEELKLALKKRYATRWSFVQNNWNQILPIDLQFFFNTNVDPEIVYGD